MKVDAGWRDREGGERMREGTEIGGGDRQKGGNEFGSREGGKGCKVQGCQGRLEGVLMDRGVHCP